MTQPTTLCQELPFRGDVKEIAIIGNGNDSQLRVIVPDGRGFVIPLSGARTKIDCGTGIKATTLALDDLSLLIRYEPQPGYTMKLTHAEIDYPGSEAEWVKDCEIWNRMNHANDLFGSLWCVQEVRMELLAQATL